MRTGRPKVALILTDEERQRLDSLAHRSRSAPALARRARIILACAEGTDSKVVARRLHVTPGTVCKWRGRFITRRLDGLYDEPRPGAKRTITDEQVEAGDYSHAGNHAARRHALEYARDGESRRPQSHRDQPHVAHVRTAAASDRDVQAVERPAARREGARYRRALSGSAGARGGILRR